MAEDRQPSHDEIIADLFAATITKAMLLDPAEIEKVIRATAGPSLGGGGEPVSGGGIGNPTMNAAIRALTSPSKTTDDLADVPKLHRAVAGFVDATNAIWRACWSGPVAVDWDDAIKGMDHLLQMGTVRHALSVGTKIAPAIYNAQDSVLTVQRIHDGHCPHAPDMFIRSSQAKSSCRSCIRVSIESPRSTRLLCRSCWRDVQQLAPIGEPVELQTDPNCWPSVEMLRARADGRRVDLMRERQAWMTSHGIDARGQRRAS